MHEFCGLYTKSQDPFRLFARFRIFRQFVCFRIIGFPKPFKLSDDSIKSRKFRRLRIVQCLTLFYIN
nr:MAG TPA: hypothetical protein [Caudoviricetes sp.]